MYNIITANMRPKGVYSSHNDIYLFMSLKLKTLTSSKPFRFVYKLVFVPVSWALPDH